MCMEKPQEAAVPPPNPAADQTLRLHPICRQQNWSVEICPGFHYVHDDAPNRFHRWMQNKFFGFKWTYQGPPIPPPNRYDSWLDTVARPFKWAWEQLNKIG